MIDDNTLNLISRDMKKNLKNLKNTLLNIKSVDENWFFNIFNLNGNSILDASMKFFSKVGDGFFWPILSFGILVYDWQSGISIFRSGILAFAIELPIFSLIKRKISRTRPYKAFPHIIRLMKPQEPHSFPSGHTAGAFLVAFIIGEVIPLLFYPLIGLASLIGFSRIYVGVHYPSDVIAGMIGGILSAIAAIKISN